MKLATEFIRLPLRFDAERLAAEVLAFDETDWKPHPQGYPGNKAMSLIAVGGDPLNDATAGPMRPTRFLERCPYLRQALAALDAPIGRTRLMRLDGNAEATAHADTNYYWTERVRVHIPVQTTPNVRFLGGDREVNMAPGECWIFDTWKIHNVLNPEPTRRIHLVADTVGSAEFWEMAESGDWPFSDPPRPGGPARFVPYRAGAEVELATEAVNQPVVMTPWEHAAHRARVLAEARPRDPEQGGRILAAFVSELEAFERRWQALWARFGAEPAGHAAFRELLAETGRRLARFDHQLTMSNNIDATEAVRQWMIRPAINPQLVPTVTAPASGVIPAPGPRGAESGIQASPQPANVPRRVRADVPRRFDRPVFIVSPPRSGSSLLFETLAQSPDAWTIGGESHAMIERIPALDPARRGFESNRLTEREAHPAVIERLIDGFFLAARDRGGRRPSAGAEDLRLLEKTPKNALRVPFLAAAFPDALFVYLYRNPRETISSMFEAWRSGRFVTYPRLPGWTGPNPWSLALVPGWRDFAGLDLAAIAARQWKAITEQLLADLEALPAERWCVANYGALVSQPQNEVVRLCRFLGLRWDRDLTAPLPAARHTLTPPEPGKWRRNREVLEPAFPLVRDTAERALEFFARRPGHAPLPGFDEDEGAPAGPVRAEAPSETPGEVAAESEAGSATATAVSASVAPPPGAAVAGATGSAKASPLRSVHTPSLAELLNNIKSSLILTTYQSGRVVLVRGDGEQVSTHFSSFPSPMGVAVGPRYLALGTRHHIWEFRNVPAAARRVLPEGKHDACYLPRRQHFTGDLRVHEMVFAKGELWIVNTRFSCLCSLDAEHSFVPRWRPPFITALAAEDRCHLNGVAVADGEIKYVTALGRTDTPAGWRDTKADGGLLLDIASGEPVATGLSMPHSPRVYQGKLWVLESGKGELNVVDPGTGRSETVAQLPGFTRGLAFAGPFAFIGLSQVRESVFGGIPLAQRLKERVCGVWVVDIRSGRTVGFLRFEDAVQEIFDVQLLRGARFPYLSEPGNELVESTFVVPPAVPLAGATEPALV